MDLTKIILVCSLLSFFLLACSQKKLKNQNNNFKTTTYKMINWTDIIDLAAKGNLKADHRVLKSEQEWKNILNPEQFRILRQKGTERAYVNNSCTLFEPGIYACAACKTKLFDATEKFDSGTGWPSFTKPLKNNVVSYNLDDSFGMERIEAICSTCDSHLGHVFPDGPKPSGLRFCMNSTALEKVEEQKESLKNDNLKTAVIGGGCFWCTEAMFKDLKGVDSVLPGYTGGKTKNPTYKEICTGTTGHAEVILIKYNPKVISYEILLNLHLASHDPTQLNRQGNDVGTQYRSSIFPANKAEIKIAEEVIMKFQADEERKIVTTIEPLEMFYEAEEYHKNYFEDNSRQPYCSAVVAPKIKKFRAKFSQYLKD